MALQEINNSIFDDLVAKKQSFVIKFYTDWCGPCKMYAKEYEEATKELIGIKMYTCNADNLNCSKMLQLFSISSIPCTVIVTPTTFKSQVGYMNKDALINWIKSSI